MFSLSISAAWLLYTLLYLAQPEVDYYSDEEDLGLDGLTIYPEDISDVADQIQINQQLKYVDLYDLSKPVPSGESFSCTKTSTLPPFQICLFEPKRDKYISQSLFSSGLWEPYITKLFVKSLDIYPKSWAIDIGANVGYYTLLAASKGHQTIAVEPSPSCVLRLHKGVHLNQLVDKVHLIINAISDSITNVTLSTSIDNQGGVWINKQRHKTARERLLKTTTIDHLVQFRYISQAIVIIDIEGHECNAFKRARTFLKKVFVPYIFMEWKKVFRSRHTKGSACPSGDLGRMTAMLSAHGYVPYEVLTGFQLDPLISTTGWHISDIYWRHNTAPTIQKPY